MLNDSKIIKSQNFERTEMIVITLHGYGTCGDDFAEVGDIFLSKKINNAVFLFPNAPEDCEAGFGGRQWFSLDELNYEEIRNGLEKTAPILSSYIIQKSNEYNCKNVCLIGFSQGTIMALEMIYHSEVISKIVAYSGLFAMPKDKTIKSKSEILLVHSDDDEVVPYKNAEMALNDLDVLGIKTKLVTCHGIGHSISIDGWQEGVNFLNNHALCFEST